MLDAVTLTTAPAESLPVALPQTPASRVAAPVDGCELLTPPATGLSARITPGRAARDADLRALWRRYEALAASGLNQVQAAAALGISPAKLTRLKQRVQHGGAAALARRYGSGRPCDYAPTADEVAVVRELYARLDAGHLRGPNTGSSKIAAYRMAARGTDARVSELFRAYVLRRATKRLPDSWMRLLDTTESVMRVLRQPDRLHVHISTPRRPTWVNADGVEVPLRAGDVFEADDGTLNFYCWVPWPFGGDKCADRYGVRLGRYQFLPVVDVRTRFIVSFHVVVRGKSSYRGEDVMALFGDTFRSVGLPQVLRLERGSWESQIVRDALALARVPVVNAWHAKQKNAVENSFHRLWTPMSLIPGHVGRDRGEYERITDLAIQCQEGARDPRQHFLALEQAVPEIIRAVQYTNTEPVISRDWGTWVPQASWESQTASRELPRLDPQMSIFFAREQRHWMVRGGLVGNAVTGPLLKVPVYFQTPELAPFEGIKTRCYFDAYAPEIRGTILLDEEWKGFKPGHVIARDVPALDLPPTLVLREDYGDEAEARKTLAVRKAMAEAVRTEAWTWLGQRTTTARDGMGRTAQTVLGRSVHGHAGTGDPCPGRGVVPGGCRDAVRGPAETPVHTPRPAHFEISRNATPATPVFASAFEEALM